MYLKIINTVKNHSLLVLFCIVYLLVGFFTYKDYGITADEYIEYTAGKVLMGYYIGKEVPNDLEAWHFPENSTYFRTHTGLYSLLNPNGYYEWYHLFNILAALPVFIFVYIALYHVYKSQKTGLLGILFLLFIPRFVGHIPGNPKDIPFAVLFYLGILTIYFWLEKPIKGWKLKWIYLTFTGMVLGITQSSRFLGFILLILFGIFYLFKTKDLKKTAIYSMYLFSVSLITMYALMPVMHGKPLQGLIDIALSSKKFTPWNNKILFEGNFLTREERPWYYLFTWIWISSPLYLIVSNAFGLIKIKDLLKNTLFSLSVSAILLSILLYLIFNPIVYNGLRHFLFLLPLFSTAGCISFIEILKKLPSLSRIILRILLIFNFLWLSVFYLRIHPYQYIYFNELFGGLKAAHLRYDSDYWSTSYKEGSEMIKKLESTEKEIKKVYPCTLSFGVQYYAKGQFEISSKVKGSKYLLCDKDNLAQENFSGEILNTVSRLNSDLLYLIQTKSTDSRD